MSHFFDGKVEAYSIGRPTYPKEILKIIANLVNGEESRIADIGAGTGLLTKMLSELNCHVIAIEPDENMLQECRQYCFNLKNIDFLHTTAEYTTLNHNSIDLITIAQAFHWFDKTRCKQEFQRILKDNGHVLLLWNEILEDSEMAQEYSKTLHQYKVKTTNAIASFNPDEEKRKFFGQDYMKLYYDHWHSVTEEGFIGGAVSLSYTPSQKSHTYMEFVQALHNLFSKYQKDGKILFHYKTEVCVCQFAK